MTCLLASPSSVSVPSQTPLVPPALPAPPAPPALPEPPALPALPEPPALPVLPEPRISPPPFSPGDTQQSTQQQIRNRNPRCWACTSGRKRCTFGINASSQTPCQRCQKLGRECSDEAPKVYTRRTLSWLKCASCRTRKLKCEFPDGPWPTKCRQCNMGGLECSEPRETERRAAKGKLNPIQGSLSDSHTKSCTSHTEQISHTKPCTSQTEQIPPIGISEETINDATLLLQLQKPLPMVDTLLTRGHDVAEVNFLSPNYVQPTSYFRSTNYAAMSSWNGYKTSPAFNYGNYGQFSIDSQYGTSSSTSQYASYSPPYTPQGWIVRDEPPSLRPSSFYQSQFNSGDHEDAVYSETLSSSSLPTERNIDERREPETGYFGALSWHMQDVHRDVPELFDCPYSDCERRGQKGFKRKHNLTQHIRNVHRELPLFDCLYPDCERRGEKGFKRKDNLTQHLRNVHGSSIAKRGRP